MVAVFLVTMILYVIYLRVLDRKYQYRVITMQGATIPFRAADATRWIYKRIIAGYSLPASDEGFSRPSKANIIEGAKGWGLPGTAAEGIHFKEAILGVGADLHAYAREALLTAGIVPSALRLDTLRGIAPDLVKIFKVQSSALWPVISTIEKADYLRYEFTADEFALFREQVWAIMDVLRRHLDTHHNEGSFTSNVAQSAPPTPSAAGIGLATSDKSISSASLASPVQALRTHDSLDQDAGVGFRVAAPQLSAPAPTGSSGLPSPIEASRRGSPMDGILQSAGPKPPRSAVQESDVVISFKPSRAPSARNVALPTVSYRPAAHSSSSLEGDFADAREDSDD